MASDGQNSFIFSWFYIHFLFTFLILCIFDIFPLLIGSYMFATAMEGIIFFNTIILVIDVTNLRLGVEIVHNFFVNLVKNMQILFLFFTGLADWANKAVCLNGLNKLLNVFLLTQERILKDTKLKVRGTKNISFVLIKIFHCWIAVANGQSHVPIHWCQNLYAFGLESIIKFQTILLDHHAFIFFVGSYCAHPLEAINLRKLP